ncbi:MAG: MarR family transcriptional regulator [Anaerolineae bacterium]
MDANFDRDVETLWSLLFAVVIDAEKRLAALVAAHDLTPPQFFVLKTLIEHGGRCPIGQIAREHHLTNATMSGLVQRLESFNPPLVLREPDETDRRSVLVKLTDEGQSRFRAVQQDIMGQMRQVLQLLNPQGRQELIEYINRYLSLMSAQYPWMS